MIKMLSKWWVDDVKATKDFIHIRLHIGSQPTMGHIDQVIGID
jgi:hypothetical protein